MRQLKEINEDIETITNEITHLQDKKERLMIEKRDRSFSDFCEKYGVKRGDIVELKEHWFPHVKIAGASLGYIHTWIVCNKIKKNGDPDVYATYIRPDHFDGCKIIKSNKD